MLFLLEQPPSELSILLLNDKKMQELNSTFRGVHKSTDVLSFEAKLPLSQAGHSPVLGDIVINIHRVAAQAKMSGTGFYEEINRLLIHGILHLLGYDHEKSRYRAMLMKKKEQEILNALKKMG